MKIKLIFFIGCCISTGVINVAAQTQYKSSASAYTGLGAYSSNSNNVFSFSSNQAALAQLKNTSAGLYGERRFMLAELNNYIAAIGLHTSSGNFGLKASSYGFKDYSETQVGLAYGRSLGKKIDVGVQFNYNGIRIASYGNVSAISFELGTMLHLSDQLHAGLHINNPVGGKFGKDKEEKLSSLYAVGIGYDASDKFFISAEIEKEEDQPVNVNAGFEYKFVPQMLVRAGIASATSSVWLGAGLLLKSFRIDITASYHPQLGITPGLLLLFTNKKTGK